MDLFIQSWPVILSAFTIVVGGAMWAGKIFFMLQGIEAKIDHDQGANIWMTIGLREGKNREIRRAMSDIGLTVNRLIRISYGPFQLGQMKVGEVVELRGRIVRDQLGLEGAKTTRPEPSRRRKPRPIPDKSRRTRN